MAALADRQTLRLAKSILNAKDYPERPPTENLVAKRARFISQDELLSTHRHGSLSHRDRPLERELRERGKSAKPPKDVRIAYPPLPKKEEEVNQDTLFLTDDATSVGKIGPGFPGVAEALPTGPPVMVISERLLTKPTWIIRTEKFWWCGGVHKCAPRNRAPAQLRPTVYGFHSKKHIFGSAPTMSKVDVFDRSATPPFKMAPPPTVGTSRREIRPGDKKPACRLVPESVSVLRPWLTDELPLEATGVKNKNCLIFLPCLTHPSFFNVAHPFKEMPFVPPPQGVDTDLAFKGVLSPGIDSPLPEDVNLQEDCLTSTTDVTSTQ